ncbi:MAG: amidohydrolase, partial [Acidimicrobiia bacterium]
PVWRRCVDLKVPITVHGSSAGWMDRRSPTSFVFNHIGKFSNASYTFCKALVLGGVPGRFPGLRFAFLEGGASWAIPLYNDIVGHWDKRNRRALDEHLRPTLIDFDELHELWVKYGEPTWTDLWADFAGSVPDEYGTTFEESAARNDHYDEFAGIGSDIDVVKTWFEERFFLGCEADDRTTGAAFSNHVKISLNALFSSDIGHWDVPTMAGVLPEAYELVEEGILNLEDFRAFSCNNAARLYLDMNPEFFQGTVIENKLPNVLPRSRREEPVL